MDLKNCHKKSYFYGVIDIHGATGGLVEFKASLLASHGFAALALAYADYEDLPASPSFTDMDYFEEAANWFSNHPKVLPHGIAIHGISYGSWIALLMASLKMDAIKAIVAISPMVTAFPIPFKYKGRVSEVIRLTKKKTTEQGRIWRDGFPTLTDHSSSGSKYSAITPVENISCPVLLVFGTGDLALNADFQVKLILSCMKKQGREHLCSILRYPEAGHLIEPPYSPHCYASFIKKIVEWTGDSYLVWGGEMNAHARAQEDSWTKILSFLRKNLQEIKCNL
ncbi:hypothetical protein ACROYT_G017422 [Oculina patagonica]